MHGLKGASTGEGTVHRLAGKRGGGGGCAAWGMDITQYGERQGSPGCLSWIQHGWKVAVPAEQSSRQQLARVSAALHHTQLCTSMCMWSSAARVGEDPLVTLGF